MDELLPGTDFAGYRIEAVAGRGGMGVVYRATQLGLDRTVALKVIASGLLGDARVRERFLREARAAAAIEHPNVIPIHASGEHAGRAFIAMRFVHGDDLRERIARDGRVAPARAAEIVAQAGAALDAAHAAGVVHRDVKPANILLSAEDHVYLSDFGLARHALSEADLTTPGGWVGTVDYIAPEQIRGDHVDGRADVYALGCVLHVALTGQAPYARDKDEARLWAHLHAVPPRPSRLADGVPEAFDQVVRRALEKRPEDRQRSAGELGCAALDAAAGRAPQRAAARRRADRATAVTRLDAPVPARRRRSFATAAVVAAAAAGAGGAVLFAGGGSDRSPATSGPRAAAHVPAKTTQKSSGPHVVRTVRVGQRPINVEIADGNAWVASTGTPWLSRVRIHEGRRRRGPRLGRGISDVAARRGELWVTVAKDHRVFRVRASTGRPLSAPIAMRGEPRPIDAGEGAVWVGELSSVGPDHLVEIDPHSAKVVGRVAVPEGINDIRAADGAVWVAGRREPVLVKISAATRQAVGRTQVGPKPLRVDVAAGFVWVTNQGDDTVARVDPKDAHVVTIGVPSKPYGLHARPDGVWVACYGDQSVVRIDPRTSRVTGKPIPVGLNPVGVDVSDGSAWVTGVSDNTLTQIDLS